MIVNDITRNRAGAPPPGADRLFGVEIEVENGGNIPERRWREKWGWNVVEDGSLRNGGIEFVSTPQTLANIKAGFTAFTKIVPGKDYRVTHRTGIHVHVDMRDLELAQVAGVCAAYAAFEPLLFHMAGQDREECIYCVPWYRATSETELVRRLAEDNADRLGKACKYSALFLKPLTVYGTIEFRQAPTWLKPKPMFDWLDVIDRMVRWGAARTPQEVLTQCSDNAGTAVQEVFENTLTDVADPEELMDLADSLGTVEEMLPCTYKASEWVVAAANGEPEAVGYHQQAGRPDQYFDLEADEVVEL